MTQMVTNKQVDKETVAHPYRVLQASDKREWAINTHHGRGESQNNDTEFLFYLCMYFYFF